MGFEHSTCKKLVCQVMIFLQQDIKNNMEINDKDAVAADASTSITVRTARKIS